MIEDWRKILAGVLAIGVFVVLIGFLKMRNWMPFVAAGAVWGFVMLATAKPPIRKGPGGAKDRAGRKEENRAIGLLEAAAKRLRRLSRQAPAADRPMFQRMADLFDELKIHHIANPAHVKLTDKFRKHVMGRMLATVEDYIDLAKRAGPDQQERLGQISQHMTEFIPVLERIDQACLDNDLTTLEINVEVLNEQLNRRPGPR
ncbi:MAG: hypothetical protein AAF557_05620 [Pseudomonadota bacterium]